MSAPRQDVRAAQRAARRRARRRLLVLVAIVAILVIAAVVVLAQRDAGDPFSGVYWDPASGRRVEITHTDGRFQFLYGTARQGYPAERHGSELRVRDPFTGYIVVRSTSAGLVLEMGARTSKLRPLPRASASATP